MTDEKTIRMMVKTGRGQEAYALRVGERVRERYSINDELALLRQKDEKQEEYQTYFTFVEEQKRIAYKEVFKE